MMGFILDICCNLNVDAIIYLVIEQQFRIQMGENAKMQINIRIKSIVLRLMVINLLYWQFKAQSSNMVILPQNLIINGNFSQPHITTINLIGSSHVPSWTCSRNCQYINCQLAIKAWARMKKVYSDCVGQVIDLDGYMKYELVTQVIELKAESYVLNFRYFYPNQLANKKTILVYFNNQLVMKHHPILVNSFSGFSYQGQVEGVEGINNLTFTMTGPSNPDGTGFKINNVSLRRIVDNSLGATLNQTFLNPLLTSLVSVPGGRVIFGQFLNTFINFQRFQLYFFHKRVYSRNYLTFLMSVNNFMNLKGSLMSGEIDHLLPSSIDRQINFLNSLDEKLLYSDDDFVDKNNVGVGFIANNITYAVYSVPFVFLLQLVCLLLFSVLFKFPISKLFRKYSFLGLLFPLLLQGNVEVFTFYIFAELKLFFSASLTHKFTNLSLLLILFLVLLYSTALIYLFRIHYKRKTYIFLQNCRGTVLGIWASTLDKGFICFLFGVVHQLLLNRPTEQIYLLIAVESFWVVSRLFFLFHRIYKNRLILWASLCSSLLRLIFLLSCLLYDSLKNSRKFINQQIHQSIITLFLCVWACEFLLNTFYFFKQIFFETKSILQYDNSSNEVINVKQGRKVPNQMAGKINKFDIGAGKEWAGFDQRFKVGIRNENRKQIMRYFKLRQSILTNVNRGI